MRNKYFSSNLMKKYLPPPCLCHIGFGLSRGSNCIHTDSYSTSESPKPHIYISTYLLFKNISLNKSSSFYVQSHFRWNNNLLMAFSRGYIGSSSKWKRRVTTRVYFKSFVTVMSRNVVYLITSYICLSINKNKLRDAIGMFF